MLHLNLPDFEYQLKKQENTHYILDIIRKKYVALTPEEWVRQHMIHYLIKIGYPKSLIKVESGLNYNLKIKRSDIFIYKRQGGVFMIIECKSSSVVLNNDALNQVALYNKELNADNILLSNGLKHLLFTKTEDNFSYRHKSIDQIPRYEI